MAAQDEPQFNGKELALLINKLSVKSLTVEIICDYFGVPEKHRTNPNLGHWIVKWIIQAQKVMPTKRPDEMFNTGSTAIESDPNDVPTP